ncbi:transcription termination factor Rho [bacterium]|nr:transcription termination factor Rho [bacterium]
MTRHELEKMTVVKLREEAMKYSELTGVHGMKKEELVGALAQLMGLPEEEKPKKKQKVKKDVSKKDLKKDILSLKGKRDEAIQAKDGKTLKRIRKRIKKAKRSLRKLAVA